MGLVTRDVQLRIPEARLPHRLLEEELCLLNLIGIAGDGDQPVVRPGHRHGVNFNRRARFLSNLRDFRTFGTDDET